MNIGIFSELYEGDSLGGREFIVAVLAEALWQRGDTVEFVHHKPGLSMQAIADTFGVAPESMRLRLMPARPRASLRDFRSRQRERAEWARALPGGYDCFVDVVHEVPARCYSPRGILIVLFPTYRAFERPRPNADAPVSPLFLLARNYWHRLNWARLMRGYQRKTSISQYVQQWTRERWRIETDVIYPPADEMIAPGAKENLIFSLGRFSGARAEWVNKRQLEMMNAFVALSNSRPEIHGWRYVSAGGVGTSPEEQEYFRRVQAIAQQADAEVRSALPRAEVRSLYGAASIFWHAAGFGNDERITPELSEHYGIATVDAMLAGCVPVVIRKGGQPELIDHGVNGFLWDSLEELKDYTSRLSRDADLRERMAAAARERAAQFSRERFINAFRTLIEPPRS